MRPILISALSVFLIQAVALPQAIARDDWQNWNTVSLNHKVSEAFSLKVNGEQRMVDDFSEAGLYNVAAGFLWMPSKYFEMGPYFKYEREARSNGDHVNENRYYLDATPKFKWGPFAFSDRNRIEYRNKNSTDSWRYRNLFKVTFSRPLEKIPVTPFVSDEIFWDMTNHSFNQNRFAVGVGIQLHNRVGMNLYYMLKSNRSGKDWNDVHVLGTGLSLSV